MKDIERIEKDLSSLEVRARELKNQYQREWAKSNPDRVRRYQQNYWRKKAQYTDGIGE